MKKWILKNLILVEGSILGQVLQRMNELMNEWKNK